MIATEVTSFLICLLAVIAVLTNAVVIVVVWYYRHMRTFANGYVLSLAVSDILLAMALILQYVDALSSLFTALNVIYSIVFMSSLANLCAITHDRYVALTTPLQYRHKMPRDFPLILASVWVVPIYFAFLPLCWHGNINLLIHKVYLCLVDGAIVVIFVLIFAAYIRVTMQVRRAKTGLTKTRVRKRDLRKASTMEKLVRLFVFHALIFLFSWGPVIYTTGVGIFGRMDLLPTALYYVSPMLIASGLIGNPVVYGLMKPDFRDVIKRLRRGRDRKCRNRVILHTSSTPTRDITVFLSSV